MRIPFILALLASSAAADERAVFYGTWGTAEQCAGAPIIAGGTVRAKPFEISPGWLQHGQIWCSLNWFPMEARADGAFTGAHAQCGEDAVGDYVLGLELSGDHLRLRWDFWRLNGPLARCPAP